MTGRNCKARLERDWYFTVFYVGVSMNSCIHYIVTLLRIGATSSPSSLGSHLSYNPYTLQSLLTYTFTYLLYYRDCFSR